MDVVIIGAGLTGLSTAYHLEQNGFFNYCLLEKESTSGGLCRSIQQDGFTFDYTGHLLHINDPYFEQFIKTVAGLESFNAINRRSYIYSQDRFTNYPYQINLHGLSTQTIAECVAGFVKRKKCSTTTFYGWVLNNFGAGFAKHFFFPYQEKIFDFPVKKLSSSWTGRFVPSTSLEQIIAGIAPAQETQAVGYNAQFYYPKKNGIYAWVDQLQKRLLNRPQTNCAVQSIDPVEKKIILHDGSCITYKKLVSTMPLTELLKILKESPASSLKRAIKNLKCNTVINFNIGVAQPDLSLKHWVYYPEKQYPFYRIGFNHNFSDHMTPTGCSSLYGEIAFFKKTPEYQQQLLTQALSATKQLWHIQERDILTQKIITIPHAYVIYDRWRDLHLHTLLKELAFLDIYSVGRYGAWKYSSMQEGILDGKQMANELLEQFGSILVEKEHHAHI